MKRTASILTILVALSSPTFGLPPVRDVLPLSFIPNEGQTDASIQFLAQGLGYGLFLSPGAIELVLKGRVEAPRGPSPATASTVTLAFVGANVKSRFEGVEVLPGRAHFLMGDDPKLWRAHLPTFRSVRYSGLYSGVDLVLYGYRGELEYDLVVAPGQDPSVIRLAVGGDAVPEIDSATGDLVLVLAGGDLRLRRPYLYQERNGARAPVAGSYAFDEGGDSAAGARQIVFAVGEYDETLPLVIDPVLVYSSYLGGGQNSAPFGSPSDAVEAVAADADGNAYVAGRTQSLDFPRTVDPQGGVGGLSNAFVAKVASDGQLVYSTFFGGSRSEGATGVAVDQAGNVAVIGITSSQSDFPVVNALQSTYGGSFEDAFVSKLTPDGSQFIYSTYFGGSGRRGSDNCGADLEFGSDIAMDAVGNAYITGYTCSHDIRTTPGAFSRTKNGFGEDSFVTKLSPSGQLVYSTYLGGRFNDEAEGIAIDSMGRAVVTGETISDDFPMTANAFQPSIVSAPEGFVTRLSPDGSALEYSTYLGGRGSDSSNAIAVDSQGNLVAAGNSASDDFPVLGVALGSCQFGPFSPGDAFVTKIDPATGSLIFSTCLGGSDDDRALAVTVDAYDDIWVAGRTSSSDFPVTPDALQPTLLSRVNAYVASLASDGSSLGFSTFFGGTGGDVAIGMAHAPGSVFVGGLTTSLDFPLANPFQGENAGSSDGFIARLEYNEPPSADSGGPYEADEGGTVQLMAFGSDPEGSALSFAWDLDGDGTFETAGESVPFSAIDIDGPATIALAVRVTDDIGLTSDDASTVEVRNVPPTATFSNISGTQILGTVPALVTLSFTDATDPSAADVAFGFLFSYDCDGDGSFEVVDSPLEAADCPYGAAGSFNAVGRIADKDGGFNDYTVVVEIQTPRSAILGLIDKVEELVEEGKLASSAAQDLLVHLQVTLQQLDKGKIDATLRQLRLFIASVERDVRQGRLSSEDGDILIDCAEQIIAALGG